MDISGGEVVLHRAALLVVDMQVGFFENTYSLGQAGMNVEALRSAIPGVLKLVEFARTNDMPIIFTRYVYHPGLVDFGIVRNARALKRIKAGSLAPNTEEVELIPELEVTRSDIVIDKSRPSAFYGTRLDPIVNSLQLDTLIICGVTTNVCVETTARDSGQRDLDTIVISDATAETSPERHAQSLASIDWGFGRVMTTADFIQAAKRTD